MAEEDAADEKNGEERFLEGDDGRIAVGLTLQYPAQLEDIAAENGRDMMMPVAGFQGFDIGQDLIDTRRELPVVFALPGPGLPGHLEISGNRRPDDDTADDRA